MDPELRSVIVRYTWVAVVLAGSVVWAALYTTDRIRAQGGTSVDDLAPATAPGLGINAPSSAAAPTPGSPAAPGEEPKAPSLASLLVTREGATRVACGPACRLEAYCGLRDAATCARSSCDGDLRRPHASDLTFARADTCVQAAAAPCEEACARRGTCSGSHGDDLRCIDACLKRADDEPARAYVSARCMLESACGDMGRCEAL